MDVFSRSAPSIASINQKHIQLFIQYASITLVWYDYMLTFSMEVNHLWRGKSRRSSILSILLYIPLRYPLVANVLYLFAVTGHLGSNCDVWYKFIGAISVIGRASVLAIFTLRTMALYDQNIYIGGVLGLIAVACVGFDITHVPGLKCSGSVSIQIVSTLLSISVCVFELLASSLILIKAMQEYRAGGKPLFEKTLVALVTRQGLLYFCGVFSFQFTAVMLNFLAKSGTFSRLINGLTLPMSCILAARFLLKLRAWDANQSKINVNETTGVNGSLSIAVFAVQQTSPNQSELDNGHGNTSFMTTGYEGGGEGEHVNRRDLDDDSRDQDAYYSFPSPSPSSSENGTSRQSLSDGHATV